MLTELLACLQLRRVPRRGLIPVLNVILDRVLIQSMVAGDVP